MIECRYLLALLLFTMGIYALYFFFVQPFALLALLVAIILFVLAYHMLPDAHRRQSSRRDNDIIYDVVDFLVSLPVNAVAFPFRFLGRFLKHMMD